MCAMWLTSAPPAHRCRYPPMTITRGNFKLHVKEGQFALSQINVIVGQNGTGKTTFLNMLGGFVYAQDCDVELPSFNSDSVMNYVEIIRNSERTVGLMLYEQIRYSLKDREFVSDVVKPLISVELLTRKVVELSDAELQLVGLCICLGNDASIYLIDELSEDLDPQQRRVILEVIKNFIMKRKRTAFVVERDPDLVQYLADRVILLEGNPSLGCCTANSPLPIQQHLADRVILFEGNPSVADRVILLAGNPSVDHTTNSPRPIQQYDSFDRGDSVSVFQHQRDRQRDHRRLQPRVPS